MTKKQWYLPFGLVLAVAAATYGLALDAKAADNSNAMWANGLRWQCETKNRILCERDGSCRQEDAAGSFALNYDNNQVEFGGAPVKIGRYYQQTTQNSPLQAEIKVELTNNAVLWLTAVDASATYSNAWVGSITTLKGGVVLLESQSVFCTKQG